MEVRDRTEPRWSAGALDSVENALAEVRRLVEASAVNDARRFIKEVVARWPEHERVQHWDTVLAPPVARLAGPDAPSPRSYAQETRWVREHAHEYPGEWLAVWNDGLVARSANRRDLSRMIKELPAEVRPLVTQGPTRA